MFKKFSRTDARFLLLVVAAHAVFFIIALQCKRIYNGDSHEYIYMATNIKNSWWFYSGNPVLPVQEEYMTLRPPGYSLFLWLVYLFSINNWLVILLQNVISIFNVYFLRHTVRTIGYKRSYDWLQMAFVLLYPSQFVNANTIAPDILLQTSVLFYFYFFLRLMKQRKWRYALGMSAALAAGIMIKPVLYPVVYMHALTMLMLAVRRYDALLRTTFCALLPLTVVMLYGYINYSRTGKLHFSSVQSFNAIFYYYNFYKDEYDVDKAEAFLAKERKKIASIPVFADRYDYANARGMQLLRENFFAYSYYHFRHSLRVLVDPGKGELDMFTGFLTLGELYDVHSKAGFYDSYKQRGVDGVEDYVSRNPTIAIAIVIFLFNVVRLAGLILFIFSRKYDVRIRIFITALVAYFVFIAGPIANPRYFIPVSLIVMSASALGYQHVLQRLKNKAIIALPERYLA